MDFNSPEMVLGFGMVVAAATGGITSLGDHLREKRVNAERHRMEMNARAAEEENASARVQLCWCQYATSDCTFCAHAATHAYSPACDPPRRCPRTNTPRCHGIH